METPIDETAVPRQAMYRGKRVRVLSYLGKNTFKILDSSDTTRIVNRSYLTFVKGKKK